MGFSSALKRNWKGIGIGIDKKELELELLFFIPKELELELNVKELELELNWKKGIDPSPVGNTLQLTYLTLGNLTYLTDYALVTITC